MVNSSNKKSPYIKTFIRYPGGKSKALDDIIPHVPTYNTFKEPFVGGGSIFLRLAQMYPDRHYWINDLDYSVYCIWRTINEEPMTMMNYIMQKKDEYIVDRHETKTKGIATKNAENGRKLHSWCRENIQKYISDGDIFHTACLWYILNKTSFSGMAMIGSFAPLAWDQNFSDKCIFNLPAVSQVMHNVKSLKITNLDYSELLKPDGDHDENTFLFMDPPYDIKDMLYGHNGNMHRNFNHQKFAEDVKQCSLKWLITYNDNENIKKWFEGYHQLPWELQYTMKAMKREGQEGSATTGKSGKKGKELLIANYPLTVPITSSIPS